MRMVLRAAILCGAAVTLHPSASAIVFTWAQGYATEIVVHHDGTPIELMDSFQVAYVGAERIHAAVMYVDGGPLPTLERGGWTTYYLRFTTDSSNPVFQDGADIRVRVRGDVRLANGGQTSSISGATYRVSQISPGEVLAHDEWSLTTWGEATYDVNSESVFTLPPGGRVLRIQATASYNILAAETYPSADIDLHFSLELTEGNPGETITVTSSDGSFGPVTWSINLGAPRRGDLNCDDVVDNGDIDAFVVALTDPAEYRRSHPACNLSNGDTNADGSVDNGDIDAFVALLLG